MIPRAVAPAFRSVALLSALLAAAAATGCARSAMPSYSAGPSPDEAFENGAHRKPTAQTLHALGRILAAQGRDDQAAKVFRRILRDHPDFLPVYGDLSALYLRQGHTDLAADVLADGLKRWPRNAAMLNDLGMCCLLRQQYKPAADLFTRAAAVQPYQPRYRANLAAALGMLGRYDESQSLYEQVLDPADVHYNLAVLCEARHDPARATKELLAATALQQQAGQAKAAASAPRSQPSLLATRPATQAPSANR